MFKKGLVGVLGLLFWVGVVMGCFGIAEAAVVDVSLPDVTAEAGATGVVVPVEVSEAEGLAGFTLEVTFNPAVIRATGATVEELNPVGWMAIPIIDNEAGTVGLGAAGLVGDPPAGLPPGSGSIAKLTFNVVGNPGQSTPLIFTRHALADEHGVSIPSTTVAGSFTVVLKGDINNDGRVTLADIMLCVRMRFGEPVTIDGVTYSYPYPPALMGRADINKDGGITLADIMLVVRRRFGP